VRLLGANPPGYSQQSDEKPHPPQICPELLSKPNGPSHAVLVPVVLSSAHAPRAVVVAQRAVVNSSSDMLAGVPPSTATEDHIDSHGCVALSIASPCLS